MTLQTRLPEIAKQALRPLAGSLANGGWAQNHMEIEEHATDCLGAALLDESLTVEAVSDGLVAIGGHPRETLIGLAAWDLLHPDDIERASEALLELARTRTPTLDGSYRMRMADNTYQAFAVQALTLGEDGTACGTGSVKSLLKFSLVSEVLRAEEFARDSVETLRMLGENRPLDECLERVHRLTERHLPSTRLAISTIHDGVMQTHRRLPDGTFHSVQRDPIVPPNVELAFAQHLDGPWRAFSRMAEFAPTAAGGQITAVLANEANELVGYLETIRESTAEPDEREWMVHGLVRQVLTALLRRVRLDEQLRAAADHDPLTGLANRRRLFSDMAACDDLVGTMLLLIDLDDFSWINNNLGHHVGDQSLVALASRLRELCPTDATIARFGGDEFVVWSPKPLTDPAKIDQQLRSSIINPTDHPDRRASVRCSIGAITVQAGEAAADAIKRADKAMYLAKSQGGDSIHLA